MIPSKNQNQSLGFADDNRNTKPVPFLSKSKLLAYRQCSRRLWLEVNHADAKADSSATQASFRMGHQVGDIAHHLYDPTGCDHLIDINKDGSEQALSQSQHWLQQADAPVFEMWFRAAGTLAFADVMLSVAPGYLGALDRCYFGIQGRDSGVPTILATTIEFLIAIGIFSRPLGRYFFPGFESYSVRRAL